MGTFGVREPDRHLGAEADRDGSSGHRVVLLGAVRGATQWNGIPVLPGFGGNYCSPSLQQHARHVQPDLVITLGDVWVLDPTCSGSCRSRTGSRGIACRCRRRTRRGECAGAQLIAMSRFGQARFTAAGSRPLYVPHGIDLEVFRPSADREALRTGFGLGKDTFAVGINGANNDAIRKALPEQMLAFAKFTRATLIRS